MVDVCVDDIMNVISIREINDKEIPLEFLNPATKLVFASSPRMRRRITKLFGKRRRKMRKSLLMQSWMGGHPETEHVRLLEINLKYELMRLDPSLSKWQASYIAYRMIAHGEEYEKAKKAVLIDGERGIPGRNRRNKFEG
jgi:hypothetical protein